MIEVRRYIAGDAALVAQRVELSAETEGLGELLVGGLPPGRAFTMTDRGFVVGCAGLAPIWPGRLIAWTLIGQASPRQWRAIIRAMRNQLHAAFEEGALRIEAHTRADFPAGARFLERLGFEREGVARRWGPDGADYVAFSRIQT